METIDNPSAASRTAYVARDDAWTETTLGGIAAGDVFYLREPDDMSVVRDSRGAEVWVATCDAYPDTERPGKHAVQCVAVWPGDHPTI